MGSEGIKRVSSTKTLGVVVDEGITWSDHVDKVAKKAAKGIGMLRRSKHLFDRDMLKTIYNAFVLLHFAYCALVWNNCSKTLQNKLLKAKRKKQLETCMIQIMKGNSLDYLRELFTIHANQTYGLRSNNRVLHLPKPKTNALKRNFSYEGAAAWNNIEGNKKF